MQEDKSITIAFGPDESGFYKIIEAHCAREGISVSDYVKGVIKKDLAWGHLARRKKPGDTGKKKPRYPFKTSS